MKGKPDLFLQNYLLDGSQDWLIDKTLYKQLKRLDKRYTNLDNLKGKYGEIIVHRNLNHMLNCKGLKQNYTQNPLTYYTRYQYRQLRPNSGTGIDLYLSMTDQLSRTFTCMLEISNWGKYHNINEYIWDKRIYSKFRRYNPNNKHYNIVLMNKRNFKLIQDKADRDNVLLIPLNEHYTPSFVDRLYKQNKIVNHLFEYVKIE